MNGSISKDECHLNLPVESEYACDLIDSSLEQIQRTYRSSNYEYCAHTVCADRYDGSELQ